MSASEFQNVKLHLTHITEQDSMKAYMERVLLQLSDIKTEFVSLGKRLHDLEQKSAGLPATEAKKKPNSKPDNWEVRTNMHISAVCIYCIVQ